MDEGRPRLPVNSGKVRRSAQRLHLSFVGSAAG